MKIDYISKDIVLNSLCENLKPERHLTGLISELFVGSDLGYETWSAILTYFQRIGFISELNIGRQGVSMILHVEAFDFLNRGGFYAQEELIKKNMEKLLLEIESLKPSLPDRVNTITTIVANLTTAFGIIMSR